MARTVPAERLHLGLAWAALNGCFHVGSWHQKQTQGSKTGRPPYALRRLGLCWVVSPACLKGSCHRIFLQASFQCQRSHGRAMAGRPDGRPKGPKAQRQVSGVRTFQVKHSRAPFLSLGSFSGPSFPLGFFNLCRV